MTNKKILILVSLLLVSFLLAGCFNQPPEITSTPVTDAEVGILYTYDVDATDSNAGDVLTYTLIDEPDGMLIDPDNGLITWTPDTAGSFDVTVEVSDGKLSDTQDFTIVVGSPLAVNQPPIIYSTPGDKAIVGVTYTYDVEATDPNGDDLTYSLDVKPDGMVINSATGVINWIPTFDQIGDNPVTVKAFDGALCDTQSFTITVRELELELTGIVVDPKTMTLFVGKSEAIKSVTATYEIRGSEIPIPLGNCTFTLGPSDVPNVVKVSEAGVISALTPGVARVIVNYKDKSDFITVTVVALVEYLSTDDLANPTVTVEYGTSEDEAIAELDVTVGVVGAKGEIGTAEIAWTIANYFGTTPKDYAATGVLTLPEGWVGDPDDVTATVTVSAEATLTAADFAYVSYDTGLGWLTGYTSGWVLTDAIFNDDVQSIVVKLYSRDTLWQTNTSTAGFGTHLTIEYGPGLTGISSPFDVWGTFDYETDGFWINVRESEYGLTATPTKVVAFVTLANGKTVTAENINLTVLPPTPME